MFAFLLTIPASYTTDIVFKINIKSYLNVKFRNPKAPVPLTTA